jgi:hypothetical protein
LRLLPAAVNSGSPQDRPARTRRGHSRRGRAAADGESQVIAALNVTVHAAETPIEVLTGEYLPLLLQTAGAISADWAACEAASQLVRPGTGRVFAERTG